MVRLFAAGVIFLSFACLPQHALALLIEVRGSVTNALFPNQSINPNVKIYIYDLNNSIKQVTDAEFSSDDREYYAGFNPDEFNRLRFYVTIGLDDYVISQPPTDIRFTPDSNVDLRYEYDITIMHKANVVQRKIDVAVSALDNGLLEDAFSAATVAILFIDRNWQSDSNSASTYTERAFNCMASVFEYAARKQIAASVDRLLFINSAAYSDAFQTLSPSIRETVLHRILSSLINLRRSIDLGDDILHYDATIDRLYSLIATLNPDAYAVAQLVYLHKSRIGDTGGATNTIYDFLKNSGTGASVARSFVLDWSAFLGAVYTQDTYSAWLAGAPSQNDSMRSDTSKLCEIVRTYDSRLINPGGPRSDELSFLVTRCRIGEPT